MRRGRASVIVVSVASLADRWARRGPCDERRGASIEGERASHRSCSSRAYACRGSWCNRVQLHATLERLLCGVRRARRSPSRARSRRCGRVPGARRVSRVAQLATPDELRVRRAAEHLSVGQGRARRDDRAARHGRRPGAAVPRAAASAGGIDIVGGDAGALAAPQPRRAGRAGASRHELAGLLVGSGGPGALAGVAPGATLLPIRVAGWQRDATANWAVYGRTDQVLAGLERAVDPNGDGDAHDAARVALVGVAEPFAGFADSPGALAAEGATRLDTLVVAPAGNDGPAGPGYGSVAGPGGAPAVLTVGAVDLRSRYGQRASFSAQACASISMGCVRSPARLRRRSRSTSASAGLAPRRRNPSASTAPCRCSTSSTGEGRSLVAGRAALLPAGEDPNGSVANAARGRSRCGALLRCRPAGRRDRARRERAHSRPCRFPRTSRARCSETSATEFRRPCRSVPCVRRRTAVRVASRVSLRPASPSTAA